MSEFTDWLIQAKEADSKLTWGKIAEYAGLSGATLSDIKSGKNQPCYETCLRLARYFHQGPERILELGGHDVIFPMPVVSTTVRSHALRQHLDKIAQMPVNAQDALAKMLAPIIDHIAQDVEKPDKRAPRPFAEQDGRIYIQGVGRPQQEPPEQKPEGGEPLKE